MHRKDAIAWVVSVCSVSLRLSQAKTPAIPVAPAAAGLAIAYLLLCGIGLLARKAFKPSAWCSASKEQCSVFRIGLIMLHKIKATGPEVFAAVLELLEAAAGKWG